MGEGTRGPEDRIGPGRALLELAWIAAQALGPAGLLGVVLVLVAWRG